MEQTVSGTKFLSMRDYSESMPMTVGLSVEKNNRVALTEGYRYG